MDQPEPVDQPDLSSNESTDEGSEESVVAGTDEEVVSEGQEKLEAAVAEVEAGAEPPTEVEATSEAEDIATEVKSIEYESLQDVVSSLEDLSPEIRSHIEPVVGLVKEAHVQYKAAKDKYESATKELKDFAAEMKEYGVESEAVVERFEAQQKSIESLNEACVNTTWTAFTRLNPEYVGLTEKTKNIFSEVVSTILDKFSGDTTLDKLEEAYKYALYTSGEKVDAVAETPKVEVKKEVVQEEKSVNVNSKAQSLVADGTTPPSNPVLDVDDMSWNEILNRHLHLLE